MEDHGFGQHDLEGFDVDALMNNAGWAAGNPYQLPPQHHPQQHFHQPQPHPQQDYYSQYPLSQPLYPEIELSHQNSYSPAPDPGVQFVPSPYQNVSTANSYSVDPSLQDSNAFHGQHNNFIYAPHTNQAATVSPHSLHNHSNGLQTSQVINRSHSNSPYPPPSAAAVPNYSQAPQDSSALYYGGARSATPQHNPMPSPQSHVYQNVQTGKPIQTVQGGQPPQKVQAVQAPQNAQAAQLTQTAQSGQSSQSAYKPLQVETPSAVAKPQQAQSKPAANPLRITHPELANAPRRLPYAPHIVWEDAPIQVAPGLKSTLPEYIVRKSRSGQEIMPGFDMSSILARNSTRKVRPSKEKKTTTNKLQGASQAIKPLMNKVASLREDGAVAPVVKSPPTPTESSSSEAETSSDEESEYEEEEKIPEVDISTVRGAARPSDIAGGARWDAIGIVWKDPKSSPSAEVVKDAIEKFGTFVTSLRLQIKTNSTKAEEAAGRQAEIDALKSARRQLLEAMYQTIDAANELGYSSIVEHLGGHHKLVNALTTTLIDCNKAEDFVGKLPKAVFRLLAKFQTLTEDFLKKVKFDSIQKRWARKGDVDTKKDIATILANTIDAKERASQGKKEVSQAGEAKDIGKKPEQNKSRTPEMTKSAPSNPAKRAYDGDGVSGKPTKKFASDAAGSTTTSSKPPPPKRTNLLGITPKPIAKPVVKKRELSPPRESKLGALLASIAKPPEARPAPVATPRAPETPEEKARRERKESRRHLRVKFKEGAELEQVRLFKHEQAEDEGRQDDMLRDAHDNHLEGMMHKKRATEKVDETMDEEEYQPPEAGESQYSEPIGIDFSLLGKSTKFGQGYVTRGGDITVRTPEQATQERREGLELMAIYTDPSDIPPSPKEPSNAADTDAAQLERQIKQPTEPWLIKRNREYDQFGPHVYQQMLLRGEQQRLKASPSSTNVQAQRHTTQLSSAPLHQEHEVQAPEPTMDPQDLANLLTRVSSLAGKPYPPVEPPTWMVNEAQRTGWWDGFYKDKAVKDKRESDARAAQMETAPFQPPAPVPSHIPQQAPTSAPQMHSYSSIPPHLNSTTMSKAPDYAQQVQNLFSAYSSGENTAPAEFNNWNMANTGAQSQSYIHQDQQSGWDENSNPGSKANRSQDKSNGKGKHRNHDSKGWSNGPLDENGEYKGKKRPCRYFHDGKCTKGPKCTYLHE